MSPWAWVPREVPVPSMSPSPWGVLALSPWLWGHRAQRVPMGVTAQRVPMPRVLIPTGIPFPNVPVPIGVAVTQMSPYPGCPHVLGGPRATLTPPVPPSKDKDKDKVKGKDKDSEYGVARGIDFQNVAVVINFDVPPTVESYIHRVGRYLGTHAGDTGVAGVPLGQLCHRCVPVVPAGPPAPTTPAPR